MFMSGLLTKIKRKKNKAEGKGIEVCVSVGGSVYPCLPDQVTSEQRPQGRELALLTYRNEQVQRPRGRMWLE